MASLPIVSVAKVTIILGFCISSTITMAANCQVPRTDLKCPPRQDATLSLCRGTDESNGIVMLNLNGSMYEVCMQSFMEKELDVMCRYFGYIRFKEFLGQWEVSFQSEQKYATSANCAGAGGCLTLCEGHEWKVADPTGPLWQDCYQYKERPIQCTNEQDPARYYFTTTTTTTTTSSTPEASLFTVIPEAVRVPAPPRDMPMNPSETPFTYIPDPPMGSGTPQPVGKEHLTSSTFFKKTTTTTEHVTTRASSTAGGAGSQTSHKTNSGTVFSPTTKPGVPHISSSVSGMDNHPQFQSPLGKTGTARISLLKVLSDDVFDFTPLPKMGTKSRAYYKYNMKPSFIRNLNPVPPRAQGVLNDNGMKIILNREDPIGEDKVDSDDENVNDEDFYYLSEASPKQIRNSPSPTTQVDQRHLTIPSTKPSGTPKTVPPIRTRVSNTSPIMPLVNLGTVRIGTSTDPDRLGTHQSIDEISSKDYTTPPKSTSVSAKKDSSHVKIDPTLWDILLQTELTTGTREMSTGGPSSEEHSTDLEGVPITRSPVPISPVTPAFGVVNSTHRPRMVNATSFARRLYPASNGSLTAIPTPNFHASSPTTTEKHKELDVSAPSKDTLHPMLYPSSTTHSMLLSNLASGVAWRLYPPETTDTLTTLDIDIEHEQTIGVAVTASLSVESDIKDSTVSTPLVSAHFTWNTSPISDSTLLSSMVSSTSASSYLSTSPSWTPQTTAHSYDVSLEHDLVTHVLSALSTSEDGFNRLHQYYSHTPSPASGSWNTQYSRDSTTLYASSHLADTRGPKQRSSGEFSETLLSTSRPTPTLSILGQNARGPSTDDSITSTQKPKFSTEELTTAAPAKAGEQKVPTEAPLSSAAADHDQEVTTAPLTAEGDVASTSKITEPSSHTPTKTDHGGLGGSKPKATSSPLSTSTPAWSEHADVTPTLAMTARAPEDPEVYATRPRHAQSATLKPEIGCKGNKCPPQGSSPSVSDSNGIAVTGPLETGRPKGVFASCPGSGRTRVDGLGVGRISSPGYPRPYPHGAHCNWTVSGYPGLQILVYIRDFMTVAPDTLKIYERDREGALLASLTGDVIASHNPQNKSSLVFLCNCSVVFLEFITDDVHGARGFAIDVETIRPPNVASSHRGDTSRKVVIACVVIIAVIVLILLLIYKIKYGGSTRVDRKFLYWKAGSQFGSSRRISPCDSMMSVRPVEKTLDPVTGLPVPHDRHIALCWGDDNSKPPPLSPFICSRVMKTKINTWTSQGNDIALTGLTEKAKNVSNLFKKDIFGPIEDMKKQMWIEQISRFHPSAPVAPPMGIGQQMCPTADRDPHDHIWVTGYHQKTSRTSHVGALPTRPHGVDQQPPKGLENPDEVQEHLWMRDYGSNEQSTSPFPPVKLSLRTDSKGEDVSLDSDIPDHIWAQDHDSKPGSPSGYHSRMPSISSMVNSEEEAARWEIKDNIWIRDEGFKTPPLTAYQTQSPLLPNDSNRARDPIACGNHDHIRRVYPSLPEPHPAQSSAPSVSQSTEQQVEEQRILKQNIGTGGTSRRSVPSTRGQSRPPRPQQNSEVLISVPYAASMYTEKGTPIQMTPPRPLPEVTGASRVNTQPVDHAPSNLLTNLSVKPTAASCKPEEPVRPKRRRNSKADHNQFRPAQTRINTKSSTQTKGTASSTNSTYTNRNSSPPNVTVTPSSAPLSITPEPPADFVCPLTKKVMKEPILFEDGHIYEKTALCTWLGSSYRSPLTEKPIKDGHYMPDTELKGRIKSWKKQHLQRVLKIAHDGASEADC